MVRKKEYVCFASWKQDAEKLGWVHAHDDLLVCDDENDICIGEWADDRGWLLTANTEAKPTREVGSA